MNKGEYERKELDGGEDDGAGFFYFCFGDGQGRGYAQTMWSEKIPVGEQARGDARIDDRFVFIEALEFYGDEQARAAHGAYSGMYK